MVVMFICAGGSAQVGGTRRRSPARGTAATVTRSGDTLRVIMGVHDHLYPAAAAAHTAAEIDARSSGVQT
ncbi:hypothetical protein GCM10017691_22740 [Pseudonocardia petroleophila]